MKNNNKHNCVSFLVTITLPFTVMYSQINRSTHKPKSLRSLPVDFKESYNNKEYDYVQHISFWDKLKAWFLDLLTRSLNLGSSRAYTTFEYIKYVLLFLILGTAIYYLVKLIVNKEGRWLFGKKHQNSNNTVDLDEVQNIKEEDFKKLIAESENSGNYRLAIKYQYLFLLKKMDSSEIISYDSQKTSHDYLLQLEGKSYYTNFSKSAYYFTYIWYGEFEIDAIAYQKAASSFVTLQNQFNND